MMSRNDACYGRSPVGAQGDRRQLTVTKTLSGIKSKVKILEKRKYEKTRLDEEEWNQRMHIWEKKRERLSGSEWDKSFREAVRARMKGKKPWRTPISCPKKLSQRNTHTKSNSPGNPENCQLNSIDTMNLNNADHHGQYGIKSSSIGYEDGLPLEVVGLKRECSIMELNVKQSERSEQSELSELKNKILKSSDALKAKIKSSEKLDEIKLERTDSVVMAELSSLTLLSTRFVKTILSPIQSESESSKGPEAANSEEPITEMKNPEGKEILDLHQTPKNQTSVVGSLHQDEQSWRKSLVEKCELSLETIKNLESLETNLKRTIELSAQNSEVLLRSKQDRTRPVEGPQKPPEVPKIAQELLTNPRVSSFANEPKPKPEECDFKTSGQITNDTNSMADRVTPEIAKQIKELFEKGRAQQRTNDTRKQKVKHKQKDLKKNEAIETKLCCSSKTPNTSSVSYPREGCAMNEKPIKLKNELNNNGKLQISPSRLDQKIKKESVDENQRSDMQRRVESNARTSNRSSVVYEAYENRIAVSKAMSRCSNKTAVRELNLPPSITKVINGEDRKLSETTSDPSSDNHSKERALHAIFSCPDAEMFGNRKKPPAPPVFNASVSFEDRANESTSFAHLVFIEPVPNEVFELRARARPLSDESLLLVTSSDDATDRPREWYREFHRPVLLSEESEPEQMKSECFREIIIDRSGCRSLYDGTCQAEISRTPEKCHVRRYEVCHDTSKCSLRNSRTPSRRDHCAQNTRSRHKTVSFQAHYLVD